MFQISGLVSITFYHIKQCIKYSHTFILESNMANQIPELVRIGGQKDKVVNWKQCIFCQTDTDGADHAYEHLNRMMKGLIGISNNANAWQRFFLASPELARLSSEFSEQFLDVTNKEVKIHHELTPSCIKRKHTAIDKIKAAILSHCNPFTVEGDRLSNLITHAYVPYECVQQILTIDNVGQRLYENYVAERINGNTSLWSPIKKENNKMYLSNSKRQTVKIRDKVVDLKETKDLYGRLMVLAKSSRGIDQKKCHRKLWIHSNSKVILRTKWRAVAMCR